MHLCRFDDDKLGLVDGDVVCDVTRRSTSYRRYVGYGTRRSAFRGVDRYVYERVLDFLARRQWQGVAHNGSPVTLSMENSVCCASNACP